LLAVSAPVDSEPLGPLVPLQSPAAVHELALVDDHDSVALPLLAIDGGLAVNVTVGAGITATDAVALALPPALVQVSE
jgi:hypothetical protein